MFMQKDKALSPVNYTKLDAQSDAADESNIDFRYLGLLNAESLMLNSKRYDSSLRALQKSSTLSSGKEIRDGVEHIVFSATYPTGGGIQCYIRSDRGFNPVEYKLRIPLSPQLPNTFVVQTTKIVHKWDATAGVWFPTDIRHHRTSDDNLILDEVVTIESAELNHPVSPEVFELVSMRLRPNTPIAVPGVGDPSKYPVWHDGKVDPNRTVGQAFLEARATMQQSLVPDQPESSSARRWPYWLAGSLFTLVALWLIVRTVRQRK